MRNSTVKLTPMQASSTSSMLKASGLAECGPKSLHSYTGQSTAYCHDAARRACTTRSSMPRRRASSEPTDEPSAEKQMRFTVIGSTAAGARELSAEGLLGFGRREGSHCRSQWIPALRVLATAQDMPNMAGSQVPSRDTGAVLFFIYH